MYLVGSLEPPEARALSGRPGAFKFQRFDPGPVRRRRRVREPPQSRCGCATVTAALNPENSNRLSLHRVAADGRAQTGSDRAVHWAHCLAAQVVYAPVLLGPSGGGGSRQGATHDITISATA